MFWTLFIPIAAAGLYAAGSKGLQSAMVAGTSSRRVLWVSNFFLALWGLPLLLVFPAHWPAVLSPVPVFAAFLAGASLFAGRFLAVKALESGDLSAVVPLLGLKTLWVGLGSVWVGSATVDAQLLGAAALASCGVGLLHYSPGGRTSRSWHAVGCALGSSIFFALTDVVTQEYARSLGVGLFQPLLLVTLLLLLPLLGKTVPAQRAARPALWAGSAVVGLQTSAVILAVGLSGEATLVNTLYATRAIWSVAVDRFTGGEGVKRHLLTRSLGAVLLMVAVVLALTTKAAGGQNSPGHLP